MFDLEAEEAEIRAMPAVLPPLCPCCGVHNANPMDRYNCCPQCHERRVTGQGERRFIHLEGRRC